MMALKTEQFNLRMNENQMTKLEKLAEFLECSKTQTIITALELMEQELADFLGADENEQ